jgi:aspartate racemase
MSWESTTEYYKIINKTVKNKLGGLHSSKCILYSVDFHEIEAFQSNGQWDKVAEIISHGAMTLENAGADFIVICSNTIHKVFDEIQKNVSIQILHIGDITGEELIKKSLSKVALLGTKYTMEHDFYKCRLISKDIDVIIPECEDRESINKIIFEELCLGIINLESKKKYLQIIEKLNSKGAEAIILGCTEIGLLINQNDTKMPLLNTAYIHAYRSALFAIE